MDTKFCISKIVLLALIFTLSLSSCLSGKIDPEPEPGPIVGYRTVSLHITQAPTTRVVLYGGEVQSLCEEEYDAATRGAVTERSRSASRPIPDGEFLHFRRGDLYLVTAQGVIVRHYRLIRDRRDIIEGIPYRDVDDFFSSFYDNDQERVRRLDIEDVPGQVANIVIIGNTPHNTQGNINHIGRQLLDVRSQYDAWGVNLFGETTGLTLNQATGRWEGSMYLRPGVARIEIESITGVGAITDFTLAGIFIDNVFQHTAINGEIDRNSLWSGGTTGYTFQPGRGLFTTDSNHALFDWNSSGLGVRDANNPLRLTPPQVPNYLIDNNFVAGRWAYQVFAPHDAEAARNLLGDQLADAQQPRIVLRLHNVQLRDGTTYSVRFVTLNEFADFADIQASRVFRLNVLFDDRDLAEVPNEVSFFTATHPGLVFTGTPAQPTHIIPVTVNTNMRGWRINEQDLPNWLSVSELERHVTGTSTFSVTAANHTGAETRVHNILVSSLCGRKTDFITVIQTGAGVETARPRRFVGAFWRDSQRGERLIRMDMNLGGAAVSGTWMATATAPWIQLCSEPFSFPNETGHQIVRADTPLLPTVAGNEGLVIHGSGNQVDFRIGLRSTNPNPVVASIAEPNWRQPRYGQIVIMYNITANPATTRVHIIWVRQGEGSDYVMRPDDLNHLGVRRGDFARRWATSNITAVHATNGTPLPYTGTTGRWLQINAGRTNSVFTRYPTQTGAYFQWAPAAAQSARFRVAHSPIGNATNVGYVNTMVTPGTFWTAARANHESCPPGWRRFDDGSITAHRHHTPTHAVGQNATRIQTSEMRMSLFLEPRPGTDANSNSSANTLFGFYADGFFDRRTPGDRQGSVSGVAAPHSTVANDNRYIAHRGILFFNPLSGASLFFPAAGRRSNTGGLIYVGNEILYWSSTTTYDTTARAWILRGGLGTGTGTPGAGDDTNTAWAHHMPNRADGMPIRCVRE